MGGRAGMGDIVVRVMASLSMASGLKKEDL